MEAARMVFLALAFGVLVTAHVALLCGLAVRPPRWRALAVLVFPPLAPYFAWQDRLRVASAFWVFGFVAYIVALIMAIR